MTDIVSATLVLLALVVGIAGLVRFARRDAFAGPGIRHLPHDELGTLAFRRRPR